MENKLWYTSKTLWVNALAIIGIIVANALGKDLPAGWEVTALGVINMALRFITKKPVTWEK